MTEEIERAGLDTGAVVRASWWGTGVFTVTALAGVLLSGPADVVAFVVAVALFAAGCAVFALAYARAVNRSRQHEISVAGLFFLSGDTAPTRVRRLLLGSLAAQVVLAVGTAVARPYTSLAAGTLVPLYGLALCGLWAARYGTFPARRHGSRPPKGPAKG